MADEEDIRELIGRMGAAQRQGFHVAPGAMRIVLAALRFYLAARTWLVKPHADPHDDAPRRLPATIAELRPHGLLAISIVCDGPNC